MKLGHRLNDDTRTHTCFEELFNMCSWERQADKDANRGSTHILKTFSKIHHFWFQATDILLLDIGILLMY